MYPRQQRMVRKMARRLLLRLCSGFVHHLLVLCLVARTCNGLALPPRTASLEIDDVDCPYPCLELELLPTTGNNATDNSAGQWRHLYLLRLIRLEKGFIDRRRSKQHGSIHHQTLSASPGRWPA